MLNIEEINEYKNKFEKNHNNKIRQRLLNKISLVDLIQDADTKPTFDFNINIKTHGVTNQGATGRCWAFAGLNLLREKVITDCQLTNFEFSASFISYYDKLERFNLLLERLISYKEANKKLSDRYVASLLENAITDGGHFTQLAQIIKKYGIVPYTVFPETFNSSNTYEINLILSRLLRKFYIDLENEQDIEKLKNEYMKDAFNIVASTFGIPPETFDFEYMDINGEYHIDKNLSPHQFYEKYIGIDLLNEYVEIGAYQDEIIKYNNLYEEEESSKLSGIKDNTFLNISPKDFQDLILKQLKDNEPVYFYSSTTLKRIDGVWIDTLKRYGEIFDIDLKMDNNSILKTSGITNYHCMLITGAHLVDKKITKWKIENTWGTKQGNQGYFVATDDWVNTYVHRIVINKKYLISKQLEILNKEPIQIKKWDAKF